ncbi:hypothetical protein GCM10022281_24260 [Sphingomonas rosea]|uniref:Uncharacterized protein n=1 Tax=Sphingomonas rosea TaxID=335605 RepID=A0ABP7UFF3_9SPHN
MPIIYMPGAPLIHIASMPGRGGPVLSIERTQTPQEANPRPTKDPSSVTIGLVSRSGRAGRAIRARDPLPVAPYGLISTLRFGSSNFEGEANPWHSKHNVVI